jgi:hypothetical protein
MHTHLQSWCMNSSGSMLKSMLLTTFQWEWLPHHKNFTTHTLLSQFLHQLISGKHNFIHTHCYLQYSFGTLYLDSRFSSGAGVSMSIHPPVYFADVDGAEEDVGQECEVDRE